MKSVATKGGIKAAALAVLSIFILTACEDPRRVSWSPDGKTAAVIAGDGLRLSDAEGNLGEPKVGVELANWFPDGQHLMTVEYEKVDNWKMVEQLETPAELKIATNTAAKMLVQAKQLKGQFEKFGDAIKTMPHTREAVIYLRENKDKEMVASFGDQWTKVKGTVDVGVHRICSYGVNDKSLTDRKLIFTTMRDVKEVRLSPHGKAFLLVYRQEQDDDTPYTLAHVSVDSGELRTISSASSLYPDWSLDGKSIYFAEADLPAKVADGVDLLHFPLAGSVCSIPTDPETEFPVKDGQKQVLAHLLYRKNTRVRAIANGGIAFTAVPLQLPGSDSQFSSRQTLFVVRPTESALVSPLVPLDALDAGGDLIEYFEVNPSGKLIAIPSSKEGTVIYSVLAGSAVRVDGGGFAWTPKFAFAPSWRTDEELCLPMKSPTSTDKEPKAEVVLYSPGKESGTTLSSNWPAAARKHFLD